MKTKGFDIIHMASGHSLLFGNVPKILDFNQVVDKLDKMKVDVAKFGLFDTATQHFSSYFPDVKAEDLNPVDEDFAYPVFRALSEVIVHKDFNPIDFSLNGILKASTPLLQGQTVYPNHEAVVGNELGVVLDSVWERLREQDSIAIPAGINIRMKLDGKSNPKVVRAVQMDPPSIHSNSVTVAFDWESSHPQMVSDEFWSKLGTFDKDGQMIRRIVSNIRVYKETSLVSHGADPFAQKKDSKGNINNPKYADLVYNAETQYKPTIYYDYKTDLVKLTAERTIPHVNNKDVTENTMNEHLITIASLYQLEVAKFSDEKSLSEAIRKAKEATDASLVELSTLKAGKEKAETDLVDANGKVTSLEDKVASLSNEVSNLKNDDSNKLMLAFREEAIKLHKLSNGKADDSIIKLIQTGSYEAVKVLMEGWQKLVDAKFHNTCNKCGSTDVTRQSAQLDEDTNSPNPEKPKSHNEVMNELRSSKKDVKLFNQAKK